MEKPKFSAVATVEGSGKWAASNERISPIYKRPHDIRTNFERDYHRILHCTAYRRLKHKTQVFFATTNDHICTRIEHVNIVQSVSETIAKQLGVNRQITSAIALGHDIGHAPFGHEGEKILKEYWEEIANTEFWHEKNSLRLIDEIELLEDSKGNYNNLNLTYAVRDGIICHCGELDQNGIFPREKNIDLKTIISSGSVQPFTWEGCIVKVADKISYVGRDIDDALALGLLTSKQTHELEKIFHEFDPKSKKYSNTQLMHKTIIDLCKHSSPSKGITLSNECHVALKNLKDFNYEHIYKHKKVEAFKKYVALILHTIVDELLSLYDGENTFKNLKSMHARYPALTVNFKEWLARYSSTPNSKYKRFKNTKIYHLDDKNSYGLAVLEFTAGMTDAFAIKIFNEIITF